MPKFTNAKARQIAAEYLLNNCDMTETLRKCGYSESYSSRNARQIFNKQIVIDAIAQIQAKQELKSGVTLNEAIKEVLSIINKDGQKDQIKLVAWDKLGRWLGWDRELAPNSEKEAARRARLSTEAAKIAEINAKTRTNDESQEKFPRLVKPETEPKTGTEG